MTGAQHDHFPPDTPTAWQRLSPDEKTAQVRQAVETDGLTFSQAARALGAPSAGAIAGVVKRAQQTAQPIVSTSGQGNTDRKKPRHAGLRALVTLSIPVAPEPPPVNATWLPLPGSHPVAIELHTDGCQFPVGLERPFAFCNCQTKNGSPYCPRHDAVCFRELPARVSRKETA